MRSRDTRTLTAPSGIALAVYLVLTLVFGGMANIFIITFIIVILLQAADFWVVRQLLWRPDAHMTPHRRQRT